jgi:hypothetical protein
MPKYTYSFDQGEISKLGDLIGQATTLKGKIKVAPKIFVWAFEFFKSPINPFPKRLYKSINMVLTIF